MLREMKSDQIFVEKTKLRNSLYVENLNRLISLQQTMCCK